MLKQKLSLALAIAGVGLAGEARGAIVGWKAPLGGNFGTPGNWSPSSVPGKKDTARFDTAGAYTVDVTSNRRSAQLLVNSDKVAIDLGGFDYSLTSRRKTSVVLAPGNDDVARLTLLDGSIHGAAAVVGAAGDGSVSLTSHSLWSLSGGLMIGSRGVGAMTVTGQSGVSSKSAVIGQRAESIGQVIVSSVGSFWHVTNNMAVGGPAGGSGQLIVRPGADVTVGGLLKIGQNGNGSLEGGTLTVGGITNVGQFHFRAGTLNMTEHDLFVGPDGPLGRTLKLLSTRTLNVTHDVMLGSTGVLIINNGKYSAGHTENQGDIRVNGSSALLAGGSLTNLGNMHFLRGGPTVSADLDNLGHVFISGGATPHFTGDVINNGGFGGEEVAAAAPVALAEVVSGTEFSVAAGSQAIFDGDVSGGGDFTGGGDLHFNKSYKPGTAGGVSIDGNVIFGPLAHLDLTLVSPQSTDKANVTLNVTGTVQLADVNVTLDALYIPQVGDMFDLVDASQIQYGGSVHIEAPAGIQFQTDEGDTSLRLTVLAVPEPSALALGGAAMGALACRRRRARRVIEIADAELRGTAPVSSASAMGVIALPCHI